MSKAWSCSRLDGLAILYRLLFKKHREALNLLLPQQDTSKSLNRTMESDQSLQTYSFMARVAIYEQQESRFRGARVTKTTALACSCAAFICGLDSGRAGQGRQVQGKRGVRYEALAREQRER